MKEKKEYLRPEIGIVKFKRNDIITSSSIGDDPIKVEEDVFPEEESNDYSMQKQPIITIPE